MENSRSIALTKVPEEVVKQLRTLAALHSVNQRDLIIMLIRERAEALKLDDLIQQLDSTGGGKGPAVEIVKAIR